MRILGRTRAFIEDRDFKEILSAELISITGGVTAGTILSIATNRFELIPGLLILIPGYLEMQGNILGSLSSRLGTRLYSNEMKPRLTKNLILKENLFSSMFLMLVVSFLLGLIAFLMIFLIFNTTSFDIIKISVFSAILAMLITIPLTIITTFYLFKHKYDPDDIMGPYVTSLADIIGIAALLVVILVII